MRKVIGIVLFCGMSWPALADVNCPNTQFQGYQKQLPTVDRGNFISLNRPLFDGGKITCHVFGIGRTDHNVRSRSETGTIRGIKYRFFYGDGSGTVQGDKSSSLDYDKDKHLHNWGTLCVVDGMDDTHWCYIQKRYLKIGIWRDGSPIIHVGEKHFPSSQIAVRVDKDTPISATENVGFNPEQIIEMLASFKRGQNVLVRYQEWPNKFNKDTNIDLYGFNEAWEILNKLYQARPQPKKSQ